MTSSNIRIKSIFLVERNENEIFVSEIYDPLIKQTYYRPIGGTVEFGEKTIDTLKREIYEETGQTIVNEKLFHISENTFTHNGEKGHEIVFVYTGEFVGNEIYNYEEYWLTESNGEKVRCLWLDKQLFKEKKIKLIPESLVEEI